MFKAQVCIILIYVQREESFFMWTETIFKKSLSITNLLNWSICLKPMFIYWYIMNWNYYTMPWIKQTPLLWQLHGMTWGRGMGFCKISYFGVPQWKVSWEPENYIIQSSIIYLHMD